MVSVVTDQRLGVNASQAIKVPCAMAATTNITLTGEQTIDGQTSSSSRVLLTGQTVSTENGIYDSNTGAWTRSPDWDGPDDVVQGTLVRAHSGTSNEGTWKVTTSGVITPGTTSVTLTKTDVDAEVRADLASTTDVTKGDAIVGGKRTDNGALAFTEHTFHENRTLFAKTDFGVTFDGVTDDTAAMKLAFAAVLSVGGILMLSPGTAIINEFLKITTSGNRPVLIKGMSKSATILKAGSSLTGSAKPTGLSGTYGGSITMSYVPMILFDNASRCKLEDFNLDGAGEDVYGVYTNEVFFGDWSSIRLTGFNQRPLTFIRTQQVTFYDLEVLSNGQGTNPDAQTVMYDTTNLTFVTPNWERNGVTSGFSVEIFQPNNKGGWVFINPWFEGGSTETLPSLGFLSGGGRGGKLVGSYFTIGSRYVAHDILNLKEATETKSMDGLTLTTTDATLWDCDVKDISNPGAGISVGATCKANTIKGGFTAANVNNAAPENLGNNFIYDLYSATKAHPNVSSGFRVNKVATASGYPIGLTDFELQVTTLLIELFGNTNNRLILESGILKLQGNTSLRLNANSGSVTVQVAGASKGQFDGTSTSTETALKIYDVDNAALERVTVGSANSGGSGFKILRIPN